MVTAAPTDDPATARFRADQQRFCARIDRGMAWLVAIEAVVAVALAALLTPRAWAGVDVAPHVHLVAALLIGGGCAGALGFLARTRPGATLTRHVAAAASMAMSALFIHVGGGRIEVHFGVFVSLAFLAAYRDWRVMLTGMVTIAVDHLARGVLLPRSVFGTDTVDVLRVLEHAGYVVLEVSVLMLVCRMAVDEMRRAARLVVEAETARAATAMARQELDERVQAARVEAEAKVRTIVAGFAAIGTSIEQCAELTRSLEGIGAQNVRHAAQGKEVLAGTMQRFEVLAKSVQDNEGSIRLLVEAGAQIAQVTAKISGVAFQTNLLALNAAVEAARAGEHGKGFAVVAEEVRALSGRTSEAAHQIDDIARRVQSMGAELATATASAANDARAGLASIDGAETSIRAIQTGAEELGTAVRAALTANSTLLASSQELQRDVQTLAP
jgi:methyl-accepting chemotaxis protein